MFDISTQHIVNRISIAIRIFRRTIRCSRVHDISLLATKHACGGDLQGLAAVSSSVKIIMPDSDGGDDFEGTKVDCHKIGAVASCTRHKTGCVHLRFIEGSITNSIGQGS